MYLPRRGPQAKGGIIVKKLIGTCIIIVGCVTAFGVEASAEEPVELDRLSATMPTLQNASRAPSLPRHAPRQVTETPLRKLVDAYLESPIKPHFSANEAGLTGTFSY